MMMLSKVMVRRTDVRFAYQDCQPLPEDKRYEILDGDLCMVSSSNTKHQRVSKKLLVALARQVEERNLGEVFIAPYDVVLSDDNIVQPDILFIAGGRVGLVGELNLHGAPDLVVEILSAGSRRKDLEAKKKIYARFGIRECWIVNPDAETIEVQVWSEIGYLRHAVYTKSKCLSSPLLPSVRIRLQDIFRN
jgi:Uma2 family endonuclease